MSDTIAPAFADPAKYDLYDCKQLEAERKTLATRTAELQGLMTKAETGVAGPVVAEMAYRNDYIAVRGQSKLADEAWQQEQVPGIETSRDSAAPAARAAPTEGARVRRPAARQIKGSYPNTEIRAARSRPASHKSSPAAPACAPGPSP